MTAAQSEGWRDGEEGVFFHLPAATYHKASGFSHSMSKHLSPPARLPSYLSDPDEPSIDMVMGTLCHHRILEPDTPFPQIAVKPEKLADPGKDPTDWHGNRKVCKQWIADQKAAGKIVLSQAELNEIDGVVNAIVNSPYPAMREFLRKVFSNCDTEVSIFKNASNGVLRKARLDCVPRVGNFLADIKTVGVGMAERSAFQRTIADAGYHVQAASNIAIAHDVGIEDKDNFLFIVAERKPPFLVATYALEWNSEALRLGGEAWQRRLDTYEQCCRTGEWPGFEAGFNPIDLPEWAKR